MELYTALKIILKSVHFNHRNTRIKLMLSIYIDLIRRQMYVPPSAFVHIVGRQGAASVFLICKTRTDMPPSVFVNLKIERMQIC